MKLSSMQQTQVKTMADQMARAGFKGSKKGKFKSRSTKQQKFAIATANVKNKTRGADTLRVGKPKKGIMVT